MLEAHAHVQNLTLLEFEQSFECIYIYMYICVYVHTHKIS
jgi:hypothetical protein